MTTQDYTRAIKVSYYAQVALVAHLLAMLAVYLPEAAL